MALEIFKRYREALKLSKYRVAKDVGYGISKSKQVDQIEQTARTYKFEVFKYLIIMGRQLGLSDKKINDEILGKRRNKIKADLSE